MKDPPYMVSLFLFSTSVYICRKRRNVGIDNIPDLMNLFTGIVDNIKAGK